MASGITLREADPSDIPTPDTGKITIFIDVTNSNEPSYKDDAGNVFTLVGAAGPLGPAGGLGPPGISGEDGEEPYVVPGPQGPQGPTGATGAVGPAGPATLGPMGIDGDQGEDGLLMVMAGSGGGGGAWSLLFTRVCSASANEDFTNLSGYSEIFVICKLITKAVSGLLELRVSTDNGSTFLSASGDYVNLPTTGVESAQTTINLHVTASTAGRSAWAQIKNFNNGSAPKAYVNSGVVGGGLVVTTTALNAIRVFGSAGGNLTGGTIYVFGRV